MTIEMIFDLISQGEGVTIEFKECKNEVTAEVYPTVCSFSNRFGGHILMGVSDNGEIIGVNPNCVKDMRKNFSNTLNNLQKISPTLYLSAEEIEIDGKIILYVYVPRSSQVHTCNKLTYDRIGDADINISSNTTQMSELYMRKHTDFTEKKIFPYVTMDDLDLSLTKCVRNLLTDFICRHVDDRFYLEGTQRVSVRSIIARFFNNIGRADELGSGVRNLYKYTKIYSDSEPVLFEDDVFKAEIPLSSIATADKPPINTDKPPINQQQSLILDYIKVNDSISNSEACNILNLKPTRVKEILREMVYDGLISAVGEKKSRKYIISQ